MKALKSFLSKYQTLIVVLVVLLSVFMRLYRIGDYLTFLGDEGRDALVVKHILDGQFTLLGPRASAADFYTGPIYYYMIAPFLWFSRLDPTGPAVFIALLSIATTFLIFQFGKRWVGEKAALIAAALYAVSPLVLVYSRSSWNPNPMPFFSMVILYLLYKAVREPTWKLFGLIGFLFGIAFQLHYIEVVTGVVIVTFIFIAAFLLQKKNIRITLVKEYGSLGVGFLIGWSPFLAFEARHGFPNIRTIMNFVIHGDPNATDLTHNSFLYTIGDVFMRLFGRLIIMYPIPQNFYKFSHMILSTWYVCAFAIAIACTIALFFIKDRLTKLLLSLWLFFGVVLFGFYHKPIYDYYFEFMFPLPFILFGNLLMQLYRLKKSVVAAGAVVLIVLGLIIFNLFGSPFTQAPNKQKEQVRSIAEFVISKSGNVPFNFALLTKGNSDHAYRYYFELEDHSPITILPPFRDSSRKSVTGQLFVVCEDLACQPLGASLFEVAGFGRAAIAGQWDLRVVKVYKLVHYKGT
jgi:4-amino-4-deoxy-L-arabinose transferase-like glycosyltransferase